jgi:hypothetical protein
MTERGQRQGTAEGDDHVLPAGGAKSKGRQQRGMGTASAYHLSVQRLQSRSPGTASESKKRESL